ncbi:secretin N-terminal domain-containing protein [Sulfuriflexus mobilis]|uniref:secretin N-terminal domain-containing protein n=1 Tax=Sulfuriflexus mobilis TaxID=1811807 RepID=UPI000F841783|nr:secretin N-terminal domain-containing protein [Sulfuriflexus mobilis]
MQDSTKHLMLYSFIAMLLISTALFAADRIEVISLKHRSVNEIIPIIKPLLGDGTAVSGQGFNLIIRAPESSLLEVRELIQQLDRAPKQLRISVRRQQADTVSRQDIEASGSIRSGDAEIHINKPGPPQLRLYETHGDSNNGGTQTIHVQEGRQAYIQVGQQIPVAQRSIDQFGTIHESIEYKNATTGFYVLGRVNGDHVTLDISPHSISLNRHGQQSFDVQQASTTLNGKLGEWMELGGLTQSEKNNQRGTVYSTRRRKDQDLQIQIRAEIVNP